MRHIETSLPKLDKVGGHARTCCMYHMILTTSGCRALIELTTASQCQNHTESAYYFVLATQCQTNHMSAAYVGAECQGAGFRS